jgi:NAD(P)-dependent dehydrogenase (short-subunit alcohol dehydrogenase family)
MNKVSEGDSMPILDEHIAIVTGGSGALGRAVVDALLAAGAAVHVPYVVPEEVPLLTQRVGARAANLTCTAADVGQAAAVERLVGDVVQRHGRIDVLVHLVGGFWGGVPVAETPEERWDAMLQLNLKSYFLCARAVLPHMRRQHAGRIVAVSSRAGTHGVGHYAAYSVAKGAVITLTQALAEETRDEGICVNAIAPSTIDTPANRQAMPDAEQARWVAPEDIARVVVFLCSRDAAVTSGAVVPVYGRA